MQVFRIYFLCACLLANIESSIHSPLNISASMYERSISSQDCFRKVMRVSQKVVCEIVCNTIESIAHRAEMLADENEKCYVFTITVTDAQFPNWTISNHWYSGEGEREGRDVNEIRFDGTYFSIIEERAFAIVEFHYLNTLSFQNISSIKCQGSWMASLNLISLEFINSPIIDPPYNFLSGSNVGYISFVSSFEKGNPVNLFQQGAIMVNRVLIQHTNQVRYLSSLHLYRLISLRVLMLRDCGIEIIAENSFVSNRKLEILDLRRNKLKTLPASLFSTLMELRAFVEVQLSDNLWQCTCELLALKNQLTDYGIPFKSFPANCPFVTKKTDLHGGKCLDIPKSNGGKYKNCELEYGFTSIYLNFPKFKLKLSPTRMGNQMVIIAAPTNRKSLPFYLILGRHHTSNECQLTEDIKCIKFINRTETFQINRIDLGPLKTMCVMDRDSPNRSWPLNCMSVCSSCEMRRGVWLRVPSTFWGVLCVTSVSALSICIGMAFGFLLLRMKPKLLSGANRVVFLKNTSRNRQSSITIFIMPKDWKNPHPKGSVKNSPRAKRPTFSTNHPPPQLPATKKYSVCSALSNDYAFISNINFHFTDASRVYDSPPLPPPRRNTVTDDDDC